MLGKTGAAKRSPICESRPRAAVQEKCHYLVQRLIRSSKPFRFVQHVKHMHIISYYHEDLGAKHIIAHRFGWGLPHVATGVPWVVFFFQILDVGVSQVRQEAAIAATKIAGEMGGPVSGR